MSGSPQRRARLEEYGELLTLAELGELLGASLRTMQRIRRRTPEQLPPEFRRVDRTPRYAAINVRAWLSSCPTAVPQSRRQRSA